MVSNSAWLLPGFAALFGLLIGSFLNVCIFRIIRDQSVIAPRSYCPECGESIAWFDNIPVLSYILLRGRCRRCQEPISIRYPMVELLTSLLFALVTWSYGFHWKSLKWCLFEALMISLCFTDLEERLLPDELTISGAVSGVALAVLIPMPGVFSELFMPRATAVVQSLFEVFLAAVLLALPVWGLAEVWGRMRGREMLGLGDVKLLVLIGTFLALENGILALLIGSVGGVILGGGYIVMTRKKAGSYEIPLGTFLCFGAAVLPLVHAI